MTEMDALLELMARLRDPERGCPWDVAQTFATIAPYTLEEAFEVADAIERGDLEALREELGDLLFQVVFHARMAEEQGAFDFATVARGLTEKMQRRHPHVFGTDEIADADAQTVAWEAHKARERAARSEGVLDGVPANLPALARAQKLGRRAARVGFDWPDAAGVLDKLAEETRELHEALGAREQAPEAVEEELGDLLFTIANLARHVDVDAERALRRASLKFEHRFREVEKRLAAAGRTPDQAGAEELERLWAEVKESGAGR
ncbi:MAG: nucleoside triphosphate pyrophosphohydrolase [Gammaproteobacteria bacterium]